MLGKCDPFCRLSFDNQIYESDYKKRTYEPEWQQTFKFTYLLRPSAKAIPEFNVRLFDYDSATAADEIGVASLSGENMLQFALAPNGWASEGEVVVFNDGSPVMGKDGEQTRQVGVTMSMLTRFSAWACTCMHARRLMQMHARSIM